MIHTNEAGGCENDRTPPSKPAGGEGLARAHQPGEVAERVLHVERPQRLAPPRPGAHVPLRQVREVEAQPRQLGVRVVDQPSPGAGLSLRDFLRVSVLTRMLHNRAVSVEVGTHWQSRPAARPATRSPRPLPACVCVWDLSGPLSHKRLEFSSQALQEWPRWVQTHRRRGRESHLDATRSTLH
jgi:hypothetical protein